MGFISFLSIKIELIAIKVSNFLIGSQLSKLPKNNYLIKNYPKNENTFELILGFYLSFYSFKENHKRSKSLKKPTLNLPNYKKKNKIFQTVEEEAMDTFLAKQKAKDLEDQLRQIIILTRGVGAWAELVKMRGDIRVKRQEERARLKKEREELIQTIVIILIIIAKI